MDSARPRFRLQTLGLPVLSLAAEMSGTSEKLLGPGKPLALLAYCCTERERMHSRDYLATLLWSDSDASRARQNLRQTMWRLRGAIGGALEANDDAVICVRSVVSVDRDEFLSAIYAADARCALALYNGPFLDGLTLPGGDEFEDWSANERRHLEESLVRVVVAQSKLLISQSRFASARELLDQLLKRTPASVDAHRIALEQAIALNDTSFTQHIADTLELLARAQNRESQAITALVVRARSQASLKSAASETLTLDLVGRDAVFAFSMDRWAAARGGTPSILSLTGAGGIGKTRLLAAIAQRCKGKGSTSVVVKANQGERDVNLAFAAAIARALATKPGAAGVSGASARELIALDPGLGSFFSVAPSMNDGVDGIRTKALAIVDLIGAVCEHHTVALLLDDLHWSDAASRQIISVILGRVDTLPLMVVVSSRGHISQLIGESIHTFPLLPLSYDDVVDAIRSSGKWPETEQADLFVDALARACDGVPLSIMERLSLGQDKKLIAQANGIWSSNDWNGARQALAISAPLDQRIESCSVVEREILLALAVAGVALTEGNFRSVLGRLHAQHGAPVDSDLRTKLASAFSRLEVRGLLVRQGDHWLPTHDVIAERIMELSGNEERRALHSVLGSVAAVSEPSDDEGSLRHFLSAHEDSRASTQLRKILKRYRRAGDRRQVNEILAAIAGDRVSAARAASIVGEIPWVLRSKYLRPGFVGTLGAAAFALFLTLFVSASKPALVVSQIPMTTFPANVFSARTLRTMPSAAITMGEKENRLVARAVHVKAASPHTRIVAGDSAQVIGNVALFNTLRFESSDSVVQFEFDADGETRATVAVRNPITFDLKGIEETARLHLAGGTLNGMALPPGSARIHVRQGEEIRGIVQAEYTTDWPTASVWLSMTPTWGDARKVGVDVTPIMTPVRREVADVPVSLRAPMSPGHYWIIFVIDAEQSGMYTLSRTNWTVGHPVWGDGNDIAALPDSAIRRANIEGAIDTWIAYLREWKTVSTNCHSIAVEREHPLKECARPTGLFGIELVVD